MREKIPEAVARELAAPGSGRLLCRRHGRPIDECDERPCLEALRDLARSELERLSRSAYRDVGPVTGRRALRALKRSRDRVRLARVLREVEELLST